jgi:hypothetical protein
MAQYTGVLSLVKGRASQYHSNHMHNIAFEYKFQQVIQRVLFYCQKPIFFSSIWTENVFLKALVLISIQIRIQIKLFQNKTGKKKERKTKKIEKGLGESI